jgi:hypothetical protein
LAVYLFNCRNWCRNRDASDPPMRRGDRKWRLLEN